MESNTHLGKANSGQVKPSLTNKKRGRKGGFTRFILYSFLSVSTLTILCALWFFFTPWGTSYRYIMADTLITTQHRVWAKYLLGGDELKKRVADYQKQFDDMGTEKDEHTISQVTPQEDQKPIVIKEISGKGYKGQMVFIKDPKSIRLVVPSVVGKGEKVSSMVKRTGALLGINAGGFADPNWKGNGFVPIGLVISNGEIFYDSSGKEKPTQIVGIDKDGKMLAGKYSPVELLDMGVKEAVTFQPRLIVNGKGLVRNEADGWGIAPRTVMAQKEDGTIIFVIIDGRQPAHSIGTNLYEIQNLLLDEGAVIAANLDGGSSTVLVGEEGEILNVPASQHGERYLPTAFLVYENPDQINIPNIWKNASKKDMDPSRW